MRLRSLDILACPCDGASPLSLMRLVSKKRSAANAPSALPCGTYCAYEKRPVRASDRLPPCSSCYEEDIVEGILTCSECRRWFAIVDGIPILVRDGLRQEAVERDLLNRHASALPEAITNDGKPVNLRTTEIERTEQDRDILDEGEYWGEFFAVHDTVGDSSILDIRQRATHPTYYPYGVLERDERDRERLYGMFPDRVGRLLFGALGRFRGGRALDIGCGGGQFALEAAHHGLEVVGTDVSLGCLQIARRYAQSIHLPDQQAGMDVEYIYAEPMNPPFRPETFDLLLSKDTLHHLPDPGGALAQLARTLKSNGAILVYEHVGKSRIIRSIIEGFNGVLVPKIQRRYKSVDVPEVLQMGSANEDAGMNDVVPALRKLFVPEFEHGELMLYFEMEQLFYYAFGKRRWLTRLARDAFMIMERAMLLFIPPQHITMLARKRSG